MDDVVVGGIGRQVDEVTIDIDYKIIKHFSENLYSSPNKAVEELVVNGYDAFARWVRVFIPGRYTPSSLVVWDNGRSMNEDGLKNLWDIADSPKQREGGRVVTRDGRERKVIGKFGIGKLASYTLGNNIAHLCKTESGNFFLVDIDYSSVTSELRSEDEEFSSPILQLEEAEARRWAAQWFETRPENFEAWFAEPSWTLAVVSELRGEVNVTEGRLKWVMGHAMPIRPDFDVFVNGSRVVPQYDKEGADTEWEIGASESRDGIQSAWDEAVGNDEVVGELRFGSETGLDPEDEDRDVSYVELPALGRVWGSFRLYDESLVEGRTGEYGRSHGFFIMVLGRLINGSDPKVLMDEPSYRTFYRANYVIRADGLDDVLLANRNEIKEDSRHANELRVLQRAVYRIARARQREKDKEDAEDSVSQLSRFPTNSREHFIEPLSSLLMRRGEEGQATEDFDITEPSFQVESLGENEEVAEISSDGKGISVNSDHPYHRAINDELGSGKVAKKARTEIERLSISERLFEGFLYDLGVENNLINSIQQWRDQMYRMLARKVDRRDYAELANALKSASYKGDAEFEEAIVDMLEAMGFIAERDGSSGKKDIKMIAPAGEKAYTLTIEAKGKKSGAVSNDEAEVSGAANHRDEVVAENAVIVAREFTGFKQPRAEGPAILNECKSVGGVSIMQVDALVALARAMRDYYYSLGTPEVRKVFTEVESPTAKLERIEGLQRPFAHFSFRELLEETWRQQEEVSSGRPVPLRTLIYEKYDDAGVTLDDLKTKFEALQVLGSPFIYYDEEAREVALRQSPAHVVKRVEAGLRRREGS
jgi:hypothetical protein